jgi:hypothetical protein
LLNDASQTNANQIGLTWESPTFNGGSPVLDFTIWFDNAEDNYQELATVT